MYPKEVQSYLLYAKEQNWITEISDKAFPISKEHLITFLRAKLDRAKAGQIKYKTVSNFPPSLHTWHRNRGYINWEKEVWSSQEVSALKLEIFYGKRREKGLPEIEVASESNEEMTINEKIEQAAEMYEGVLNFVHFAIRQGWISQVANWKSLFPIPSNRIDLWIPCNPSQCRLYLKHLYYAHKELDLEWSETFDAAVLFLNG